MQRLRKLFNSAITIVTLVGMVGGGAATAMAAGTLKSAGAALSVARGNMDSVHTLSFQNASSTTIHSVEFQYRRTASVGTSVPQGLDLSAATLASVSVSGGADSKANWTPAIDNVNGNIVLTASADIDTPAASTPFIFTFGSIHNNVVNVTAGSPCDDVTNSESCFVRITTKGVGGAVIDQTAVTYTVVDPIEVTATVDPMLKFTVAGVNAGQRPDAGMAADASATSNATQLPFGNVTVGLPRIVAQSLTVLTNANNGYNVYNKFIGRKDDGSEGGSELMTGTYAGNNIDPFPAGTGAGWATEGGTSQAWISPTNNVKNVNTGYLGMRTNNGGLNVGSNFSTSNTWAPPYVGAGSGHVVMASLTPDNGTTSTVVSYKIETNAYQPADTYTGTTVYNVAATY